MTKTLTIDVRQEYIDIGEYADARLCPIALAAMEQHPCYDIGVCGTHMFRWEYKGAEPIIYNMPQEAANFINAFDNKKVVDPVVITATVYNSLDELNENIKKYLDYKKLTSTLI